MSCVGAAVQTTAQLALVEAFNRGYRAKFPSVFKPNGELQKLTRDGNGYPVFSLNLGKNRTRFVYAHRLVALEKFGSDALFSSGTEVRHLDNDKSNFSSENIALGTSADNKKDIPLELRKEAMRRAVKALTSEKRSEVARKRWANLAPEERAKRMAMLRAKKVA